MYLYSAVDQAIVDARVEQFREQMTRYLGGKLDEEVFKQLRLRNGLYIQRHGPMLRVAVPYGVMNSKQLRCLASIARDFDKGFAHVTTRQNFQFNWLSLESIPNVLEKLAEVQMHAIQTSGNCIRNVTSDPLAGVASDEIEDSRVWCEIIRQWSTLHAEFSFLPRKFKIAVTGSETDRVAVQVHDIGIQLVKNTNSETGFKIYVGGGLGRTPVIGKVLHEFLPRNDLISYLEAVLRIYNLHGRRDNIYKARIKILVNAIGIDEFRDQVNREWYKIRHGELYLDDSEIQVISDSFSYPEYPALIGDRKAVENLRLLDPMFSTWYQSNTRAHKNDGYRIVYLSLKAPGQAPGDIDHEQMDAIADLADDYSCSEVRTTYSQNLVLAHVDESQLPALWSKLRKLKLATPNIEMAGDIICCPGLDYCGLANATSLDVSEDIASRLLKFEQVLSRGDIDVKISGCMNACGHHHVGQIGLLGVDKKGEQWYQISVGGSASNTTSLGKVLGPSLPKNEIGEAIEKLIAGYLILREKDETFQMALKRLGAKPFKELVYESA